MAAEIVTQSGPGAAQPATPTPAPQPKVEAAPQPSTKPKEVVELEAKLAESQRRARIMLQRQSEKLTSEAKREREGLSSKLARLAELEKSFNNAKLNPESHLKGIYGDSWYDKLVELKLNNGMPTADVLASEIAKVEERFEAKWKEREEAARSEAESASKASVENARRQLAFEAAAVWKAKAADFPLVDGIGSPEVIARELARRCEEHYLRTTQRDEDGRIQLDGEMLPLQRVAELWEDELVKLAERAAGHQKYATRFQPKPAAPAVPKDVVQQQRRTLSNDLTGRTTARTAPATEAERRARAIAAYEAKRGPAT